MEDQFKEMGMTTVVFVCYTRRDGKLAIDAYAISSCRGHAPLTQCSFDRIPELTCVPCQSFVDTYSDSVKEMKGLLLTYAKALRMQKNQPELPFGIGTHAAQPKLVLDSTPAGYPILPIPLPSASWKKQDWEDFFTMYMGRHYCKRQQYC
jgi:hypothetical protein